MKVLLINGSPHDNGNTFLALSEVAGALNKEGVDTEIVSIGKRAIQNEEQSPSVCWRAFVIVV